MTARANAGKRRRPNRADPRPDPRARLAEAPTTNILDDIARHAQEQPHHPALDDGTTTLTYTQMWDHAGIIAEHLAAQGVTTNTPVLISGPRTTAFATATLGVLRAGAVAVPCSTMLPDARCATMATEAHATHAITIGPTPTWTTGLTTLELDTNAQPTTPDLPRATPAPTGHHAYIFFTSGTTGTPKAVLGTHAALAGLVSWYTAAFSITPGDRVSMATNVGFVVTLRNLFGPLAAGATVCIAPDVLLPEDGLTWLDDAGVSVLHVTPSLAGSWLAEAPPGVAAPVLRWTLFGGEPLTDTLVIAWRTAISGTGRVANVYGSTELGASRAWFVVPDEPTPGPQPIGSPIPGTQLLVVDAEQQQCAIDAPGEIIVRARNLPVGYANDRDATGFTTNPFTGDAGDFVYRTGDLGWYRPDGTIQLAGRTDDQFKIDGFRLDPGEVAAILRGHPAVAEGHVLAVGAPGESPTLVGFVLAQPGCGNRRTLVADLRRHCGSQLPAKAVPSRFVVLDRFPLTATGKLDRRALTALATRPTTHAPTDPRPDPRARLAEAPTTNILDDIARHAQEQPHHPALDDGTTTLTYTQMWDHAGIIAEHLAAQGVTTNTPVLISGPRTTAFATATLGVLRAGAVAVPCSTMLPDARCATMATEAHATHAITIGPTPTWTTGLTTLELDTNAQPTTPDLPRATPAPTGHHAYIFFTSGTTGTPKAVLGRHASLAQYLGWWRDEFAITPDDRVSMVTSTSFDPTLRNLFGPLAAGATVCIAPDVLLPEDGLTWLHNAHVSVLHVTPSLAGSWLVEAAPDALAATRALRWTLFAGEMLTDTLVNRWRAVNPGAIGNMYGPTETTMSRCLYVVPDEPEPGPQPVGVALPGSQVLVVNAHDRLCPVGEPGELLIRTRNGTSGYANNATEHALRFTTNPFTGDPDDIVYRTGDLGWYRPDGNIQLAGRTDDQVKIGGVRVEPAEVTAALVRHPEVRAAHVQPRLAPDMHPELIAFVVADTVLDAGIALSARLRRHCGTLLAPAAIPARFMFVERLPITSNGKVDRAALLALVDPPTGGVAPPIEAHATVAVELVAVMPSARAALRTDELVTAWRAVLRRDDIGPDTNFFEVGGSSVTAVRLAHRLRDRVGRTVTIHDLLDAQTPRELNRLLGGVEDETTQALIGAPVHERVRAHARTNPHAPALSDGAATMSYGELEERVCTIAAALVAEGVRPGSLVALHARSHARVIPVLLAIHRAGAGYVPVDPDLPSARVAFLLHDCAPCVVITDRALPDHSERCPVLAIDVLTNAVAPPNLANQFAVDQAGQTVAYLIYTSGSTGTPKGVIISQRSLASYVDAANVPNPIHANDRVLLAHSLSFDASVASIFQAFAAGATLVVPPNALLGTAAWFIEQLDSLGVTVLHLPTAFWHVLVCELDDASIDLPAQLVSIKIGGQSARPEIVNRWAARLGHTCNLYNEYGPTEVTIGATVANLSGKYFAPGEPVPIGSPLSRVLMLVVDEHNQPVADGESGELLLGGPQVAIGYHNQPAMTAQRFVTDPTGTTSNTYYRTGDRVRSAPDGQLVFEARVDDQVKIRGFRIELGEIETVLQSHPAVREAVAVVGGTEGDPAIIAHVVLKDGVDIDIAELRAHAAATLPAYALPATIERRASLPRTPGGKPDRRALRAEVRAPLGFAQEQQWFLHKLDPTSSAYNMTVGLRLVGPLDHEALDHALSVLVERHEALRTRYLEYDDQVIQVIDGPTPVHAERFTPDVRDGESPEDAARRNQFELGAVHFDLERDPLFRPALLVIGPDDHVLALRSHHIAVDGWSTDVLVDELMTAYAERVDGRGMSLPQIGAQPRELAVAQRATEIDGTLAATLDVWASMLDPLPKPLALPLDRPRPAVREPIGSLVRVHCADDSGRTLTAAARALRTTPFTIGLALFGEYLAARCGADDLVIGIPSADRDTLESDRTVGMLVNTLPYHAHSNPALSVRQAIAITTRSLDDALAHKTAPFDRIVRRVRPPRVPGLHPLFQVTFQTAEAPKAYGTMSAIAVAPFPSMRVGAKFDVSCTLVVDDSLDCRFTFARDVFDEPTMQEIAEGFARFVDAALADLDRPIPLVVAASGATRLVGSVSVPTEIVPGSAARTGAPTTSTIRPPAAANPATPLTEMLDAVVEAFRQTLGTHVGPDDDFFGAGGHSLLAVRLCSRIERTTGTRLAVAAIFEAPTPRALTELIVAAAPRSDPNTALRADASLLVTLRAGDPTRRTPLFCVHPAGGQLFAYMSILTALADEQPVIGISEYGLGDPKRQLFSIEAYAYRYAEEVDAHTPTGPIALAGYSLGGLIAYEMATILRWRGRTVRVVLLLDATPGASPGDPINPREPMWSTLRRRIARDGIRGFTTAAKNLISRRWNAKVAGPTRAASDRWTRGRIERKGGDIDPLLIGRESERAGADLRRLYRPQPNDVRLVYFRAVGVDPNFPIPDYSYRWGRVVDALEIIDVPGNHAAANSMMTQPHAAVLGTAMATVLAEIDAALRRRGNREVA